MKFHLRVIYVILTVLGSFFVHAIETEVSINKEVVKKYPSEDFPIEIVQFTLIAKHNKTDYVIWRKQQTHVLDATRSLDPSIILLGYENIDGMLFVLYVDYGVIYLDVVSTSGMAFNLIDTERVGSGIAFVDGGSFEVKIVKNDDLTYGLLIKDPFGKSGEYIYDQGLPKIRRK